jgi:hypothetical protein
LVDVVWTMLSLEDFIVSFRKRSAVKRELIRHDQLQLSLITPSDYSSWFGIGIYLVALDQEGWQKHSQHLQDPCVLLSHYRLPVCVMTRNFYQSLLENQEEAGKMPIYNSLMFLKRLPIVSEKR